MTLFIKHQSNYKKKTENAKSENNSLYCVKLTIKVKDGAI